MKMTDTISLKEFTANDSVKETIIKSLTNIYLAVEYLNINKAEDEKLLIADFVRQIENNKLLSVVISYIMKDENFVNQIFQEIDKKKKEGGTNVTTRK